MKIFFCQDCARPSLFREDRCCSGHYDEIEYIPRSTQHGFYRYQRGDVIHITFPDHQVDTFVRVKDIDPKTGDMTCEDEVG